MDNRYAACHFANAHCDRSATDDDRPNIQRDEFTSQFGNRVQPSVGPPCFDNNRRSDVVAVVSQAFLECEQKMAV